MIYPGLAQRMSAGAGTLHSENDAGRVLGGSVGHGSADNGSGHNEPVHFVQMWVVPDESGIAPGYEQLEIDSELLAGGLVPVASECPSTTVSPRSASDSGTPRCTRRRCSPAPGWHYRRRPTSTCSCRVAPCGSRCFDTDYRSPPQSAVNRRTSRYPEGRGELRATRAAGPKYRMPVIDR